MSRNKTNYNNSSWLPIYHNLKDIYLSQFNWLNLPDTVNKRYLELCIFDKGYVSFFNDDEIGYLALSCVEQGGFDLYGEALKVRMYALNSYHAVRENHKDCVIIFNDSVRDTPKLRLTQFAKRIYNIERTIDINIMNQRTPYIIKTSKNKEFTMKTLFKEKDNYETKIFVDEDLLNGDSIVIETPAPYVADKLEDEKHKLWNEVLSYIGIENNSESKNDRLTSDEVLISNGLSRAQRNSKLQARQLACEEIKKLFNIDVWVESNDSHLLEDLINNETGGNENND